MKIIAAYAYSSGARGLICLALLGLSACSSLQPPPRPLVYDFGPGATTPQPANRMAPLPPLALAGVQATGALDSTAVLYRLAYSDAQQLRPYAQARWSMPPAELLRQRLREHLGQHRAVLNPADGVLAVGPVLTLRVDLDEFSQLFATDQQSTGLLRLRATLGQPGARGEKLVAQRSFVVQRASASPDAAGGVRALTEAADAAIEDIEQWVQQTAQAAPGG
ncbi:MAG: ABC-type transport auxiliary lipoprotein family protein [Rhodoferax sp.]|nr:ABC-type transport auxiliary lipoprotein family protein [Rhodoferax sp.]MDP3654907.1 ABC-type transport auxiliary lipoprotein family protein [Rhodoferax sp.]